MSHYTRRGWMAGMSMMPLFGFNGRPFQLQVKVIDEKGAPVSGLPVRMVFSFDANPRSAGAGTRTVTNAKGEAGHNSRGAMVKRWTRIDGYLPRRTDFVAVGIEMEMIDRPVLYWVEIDEIAEAVGQRTLAFVKSPGGSFDRPLEWQHATHSYRFPGEPGLVFTALGADVKQHALLHGPESTRVQLVLETKKFERR